MLAHEHYLPVMRLKPAELRALRSLNPVLRSIVTPLLECPPRVLAGCTSESDLDARFAKVVGHLTGWSGRSVLIDFEALPSSSLPLHPIESMSAQAAQIGIRPVVVISLKAGDLGYARAARRILARHGSGICLRVSSEELKSVSIDEYIDSYLRRLGVSAAQTHLVIDRGRVDSASSNFPEFANNIPWIESWRSLTVLAGSFPKDLSELSRGKVHRLRRPEWRQWRELRSWPGRRPAFGDYTIQHVYFKEPVGVPNPSASIRYTLEDEFMVLRGEGILNPNGPGRAQWNAWAMLLTEMDEYFGEAFSQGDGYIAARASAAAGSGSPQSWLEAAFSHHVTTVALQVADRLELARRLRPAASSWESALNIGPAEMTW